MKKKLTLRQVRQMYFLVLGAAILLGILASVTANIALLLVSWVILAGDLVFYFAKYCCPHCGKYLGRNDGKFCPYCGKKLEDET